MSNLEPKLADYVHDIDNFVTAGRMLDLGCGVGHAALHFAHRGFTVDALDKDMSVLKDLSAEAEAKDLPINIVQADMLTYRPTEQYDVVLADKSLHFLGRANVAGVVERLQDATVIRGIHVVSVWSDENTEESIRTKFSRQDVISLYSDYRWGIRKLWRADNPQTGQRFRATLSQKLYN